MDALRYTIVETSWGPFAFVSRHGLLVRTFLPRPRRELLQLVRQVPAAEDNRALPHLRRQITDYFRGRPVAFEVDCDLGGVPPFYARVLQACRRIPFGHTASYADLARAAGSAGAVRAAGGAMACNPLPLIVPCHRVLRADRSLGGFSSSRGPGEKLRLPRHEGVEIPGEWSGHIRQAV